VGLRRLLALVVAIGLVVGAYIVKTRVIDKPSGTTTTTTDPSNPSNPSNPSDPTAATAPKGKAAVWCIDELRAACESAAKTTNVTINVESAGKTLDRLTTNPSPNDIWITLAPWDGLLTNARARTIKDQAPVVQELASAPVVVAGPKPRLDVLAKACVAPVTWVCVGDQVGKKWDAIGGQAAWRDVVFVHTDPTTTASGLAAYGAALAGRVGTPAFSTTELSDPAVSAWSKNLETANHPAQTDPFGKLAVAADFFLAAGLKTEAGPAAVTPTPEVRVGAIVAAIGTAKVDTKFVDALKAELGKNGWDVGVTSSGVPDATAMEAARTNWKQGN
jgi:hypothetical protein